MVSEPDQKYPDISRTTSPKQKRRTEQCRARPNSYASKQEGRKAGRQEGRKAGRQEGRKAGRQEGRKAGRQEGRKAGRQASEQASKQKSKHDSPSNRIPEENTRAMHTNVVTLSQCRFNHSSQDSCAWACSDFTALRCNSCAPSRPLLHPSLTLSLSLYLSLSLFLRTHGLRRCSAHHAGWSIAPIWQAWPRPSHCHAGFPFKTMQQSVLQKSSNKIPRVLLCFARTTRPAFFFQAPGDT